MLEKRKIVMLPGSSQEKKIATTLFLYLLTNTMLKIIVILSIIRKPSGKC